MRVLVVCIMLLLISCVTQVNQTNNTTPWFTPFETLNQTNITRFNDSSSPLNQTNITPVNYHGLDCYKGELDLFLNQPIDPEYSQVYPVTLPLKPDLDGVEIFSAWHLVGGADYTAEPFIKINELYCHPTDSNMRSLFFPLEDEEEALKYYLLVKQGMGGGFASELEYILVPEDYNDLSMVSNCGDYQQVLQNRTTSVERTAEGYVINAVVYNYVVYIEFLETVSMIHDNGTIEEISSGVIMDCGQGIVH